MQNAKPKWETPRMRKSVFQSAGIIIAHHLLDLEVRLVRPPELPMIIALVNTSHVVLLGPGLTATIRVIAAAIIIAGNIALLVVLPVMPPLQTKCDSKASET